MIRGRNGDQTGKGEIRAGWWVVAGTVLADDVDRGFLPLGRLEGPMRGIATEYAA